MSIKIASDRKIKLDEILGAFGMKAGGTVTGVAYGGEFHDDASGPQAETRDPSTGEVLAHVKTASAEDCRSLASARPSATVSPARNAASTPSGGPTRAVPPACRNLSSSA